MLTRLQSLEARKSIVPIKVYDVDHTETRLASATASGQGKLENHLNCA